eukprot:6192239-Pleurochrysis_carterae.AAC.1
MKLEEDGQTTIKIEAFQQTASCLQPAMHYTDTQLSDTVYSTRAIGGTAETAHHSAYPHTCILRQIYSDMFMHSRHSPGENEDGLHVICIYMLLPRGSNARGPPCARRASRANIAQGYPRLHNELLVR